MKLQKAGLFHYVFKNFFFSRISVEREQCERWAMTMDEKVKRGGGGGGTEQDWDE